MAKGVGRNPSRQMVAAVHVRIPLLLEAASRPRSDLEFQRRRAMGFAEIKEVDVWICGSRSRI